MAEAIVLSLSKAKKFARLACKVRGKDYRYRNLKEENPRDCVYFEQNGTPSCLVGMIFYFAGINAEPFLIEDDYMYTLNGDGVVAVLEAPDVLSCDRLTGEFLGSLQLHQDRGETWGESLEGANKEVAASMLKNQIAGLDTPQKGYCVRDHVRESA